MRLQGLGDFGDHEGSDTRGASDFGKGDSVSDRVIGARCSDRDSDNISTSIGIDSSGSGGTSATREGDSGASLGGGKSSCRLDIADTRDSVNPSNQLIASVLVKLNDISTISAD